MAEVRAMPWNGLKVASTFAGGGGSSTGYRMAGFKVVWANEFVPSAQASYRANHPDAVLDGRSIREVTAEDVFRATGLREGELDVFDGSPPCQSFSMSGKRAKNWGMEVAHHGKTQVNDDLFLEYARLLGGLAPKAFVAENVSGLVAGKAVGKFLQFHEAMSKAGPGYVVKARMLDAQWLGVPQERRRVIFVGVRKDLGREPAFPEPLPYNYTVREVLPWITRAKFDNPSTNPSFYFVEDIVDVPCPTILTGPSQYRVMAAEPSPEELVGTSFEGFAIEREWRRLAPGDKSTRYTNLARIDPDAPCPTVTAKAGSHPGTAGVTHPSYPRKFTIRELKRLCSFPDDYVLEGSFGEQWARCGNSVPPLMMRAVAVALRDRVFA